jgi:hypothetical protein
LQQFWDWTFFIVISIFHFPLSAEAFTQFHKLQDILDRLHETECHDKGLAFACDATFFLKRGKSIAFYIDIEGANIEA